MRHSLDAELNQRVVVGEDEAEWRVVGVSPETGVVSLCSDLGRTLDIGAAERRMAPGVRVKAVVEYGRLRLRFETAAHIPVHNGGTQDWIDRVRASF